MPIFIALSVFIPVDTFLDRYKGTHHFLSDNADNLSRGAISFHIFLRLPRLLDIEYLVEAKLHLPGRYHIYDLLQWRLVQIHVIRNKDRQGLQTINVKLPSLFKNRVPYGEPKQQNNQSH